MRHIILKAIEKDNSSFASEIFEEMTQFNITPDDVSYSSLIEALLEDGYMEDAYEFYIQVSNF